MKVQVELNEYGKIVIVDPSDAREDGPLVVLDPYEARSLSRQLSEVLSSLSRVY